MLQGASAKENGSTRLTTTKTYDLLNRLTGISSSSGGGGLFQFNYAYNSANQRTAVTNTDSSTWAWQYDNLGQVKSAKQSWSNAAPVAGRQMEYTFDDIGNRTATKVGGDTAGSNQRTASYTVNSLNQYTARTVPGFVEIQGAATNSATVLVNGQSATRQGEYFRAELTVDNTAPVWLSVTNLGLLVQGTNVLAAATTGHQFIPPATQMFMYDADGNQTSDGVWTNIWDAANRLVSTETLPTVPIAARRREVWSYLPDGRWSQRVIATNNGTTYFPAFTNRYVWDKNVLLAVLDHTNGVMMIFLRGLDMSGCLQGAGGVGGVLAVSFPTNGTHFNAYDGNGNVMGLLAASNGIVTTTYEYGAFGEVLRASGPMAQVNPIQFSTQYRDEVTGRVKYLLRDYEADKARWPNRDPLEEVGGANLYVFIRNDGINDYDLVGLVSIRDIASSAYNQLNSAWSSAGDAAAQEIVGWFKAFDSQAKLRVNFQVQKRYQVGVSGAVKFYVGGNLRVVSDGCCVTVAAGGFANGTIRLGPPVGWSIAGGITGNLNGKYKYCWTDGTRDLTGVFDLSANAGVRFGLTVLVGEIYGEVGVFGRYRKDLKTWKNSTAVGVYGRAVFQYGSTVREYRVTYGTGEGGEGF